jgi:methyltransferase (TIGR00027 family)
MDEAWRKDLFAQIGWTGLLITALRARESERPDALVDDPFARAVVAALGDDGNDGATRWTERDGGTSELAAALGEYVAVRTRYVDDVIVAATGAGVRQVVSLGAGLDGRAHRMTVPDGTMFFEVDTSDVVVAKEHLLETVRLPLRVERRGVGADLRADWLPALAAAGHDPNRPTVWVAEGLLYYLDRTDTDRILGAVAGASAAGSRFVTEYPDFPPGQIMGELGSGGPTRRVAGFMHSGPAERPQTWLPRFGWHPAAVPLPEVMAQYRRPAPAWAVRDDGGTWWLAAASLSDPGLGARIG